MYSNKQIKNTIFKTIETVKDRREAAIFYPPPPGYIEITVTDISDGCRGTVTWVSISHALTKPKGVWCIILQTRTRTQSVANNELDRWSVFFKGFEYLLKLHKIVSPKNQL